MYSVLPTVRMRTVCVEQKSAKQQSDRIAYHRRIQNFLEECKLTVGGASVVYVVSHCYPIFLVLPDTSMNSIFSCTCIASLIASKHRLLFHLLTIFSQILIFVVIDGHAHNCGFHGTVRIASYIHKSKFI